MMAGNMHGRYNYSHLILYISDEDVTINIF